ncbi:hypothetical protein CCO03_10500 [Comamonas serinivorans]|uniref:Membrane transport protein MMPL domain-containing protein n=1 Tax=Comamonas serinivorans TaxID=1082851 RepID=A0A1Y0EP34_9BURK|nr:MMPL family transporter [Comamonas serinivorans]ARU05062.1 hypothetical protein CCO03_10500 [Comamonas serinivorans]
MTRATPPEAPLQPAAAGQGSADGITLPRAQRWLRGLAWLALVCGCIWVLATARYSSDMSAFLPKDPSAEQQLLVDQIRDGALSRMLLLAISGGNAEQRALASSALADWLRAQPEIEGAINGDVASRDRDGAFLFAHRYQLSDRITPQRFTAEGLTQALGESLSLLASPAGSLLKPLLPRDPTAEVLHVLDSLASSSTGTHTREGVLASADGQRAILMVMLQASGTDTDAQAQALARIQAAFDRLRPGPAGPEAALQLAMTGAPYFSVQSRAIIKSEVERLSLTGTVLVVLLLLTVYRSPRTLLVGLLPVATGIVAAIAAVALGFGTVHAITIGFGTTLIGESIDFSIYYLVQSRDAHAWRTRFWPTIRLGVLTSLCGFGALTFSSFPGLAQLGLYSMAGLVAALLTTRYLLPAIPTPPPPMDRLVRLGQRVAVGVGLLRRGRWVLVALTGAAVLTTALSSTPMWSRGLDGLNPTPRALQTLDAEIRQDLGAGDLRWLVAVRGDTPEQALTRAEGVQAALAPLVAQGLLARIDSPSRFLPSAATQAQRLASLPAPDVLQANLQQALTRVPFQAQALAPFLGEAEAARQTPPISLADLKGTSFALGLSALLLRHGEGHVALLALQPPLDGAALGDTAPGAAPASEPARLDRLAATLADRVPGLLSRWQQSQAPLTTSASAAADELPPALFIDLTQATESMFGSYLTQAGKLAVAGVAGVVLLLGLSLRSARGVVRVLLPMAGALVFVLAAHALAGRSLTLLHLVGLMLVVAVGSNYALYFEQAIDVQPDSNAPRTAASDSQHAALASLLLANLSTMIGFGILAFSQVPVLQAIGATVGPGALLALVLAAAWSRRVSPGAAQPAVTVPLIPATAAHRA